MDHIRQRFSTRFNIAAPSFPTKYAGNRRLGYACSLHFSVAGLAVSAHYHKAFPRNEIKRTQPAAHFRTTYQCEEQEGRAAESKSLLYVSVGKVGEGAVFARTANG